ncbi:SPRY-domain-containing protein [Meira miltonrushii]|uniref:SPRY-domain-containing protein n=1 Tax=Meira miltonrushii TaxID=1280837 RepID=A0A316V9L4_9BASI|nr:SPRY-domain-containing protein [Meira miltonrushii]PWN32893.1 SPRY-domain-containing protein [Meira miltonrushii]
MVKRQPRFNAGPSVSPIEEYSHHPFPSKSKSVNKLIHNEGIRMRDKELEIERTHQKQRSQSHWPADLDDMLESLGLVESNEGAVDVPLWNKPPSPADHHDGSSSIDSSSKYRSTNVDISRGSTSERNDHPRLLKSDTPPSLVDHLQQRLAANRIQPAYSVKGSATTSSRSDQGRIHSPTSFMLTNEGGDGPPPIFSPPESSDETLALLLPLLVLLSTLLLLLLTFVILVIFVRRRARIALTDGDGPLDVGREEELEGLGGLDGIEERWLETVDDATRRGYLRAKDWSLSSPPGSQASEITLSQFLSIQEKGVSAWSFDPDYEINPSVYVAGRTEISFLADGEGMAPQEGGGCSVQSNLPLPKLNEVYYWETKIFTKPEATNISIGLATKPYPSFRMPGWSKFSVGYFSADGFKCHNYPFAAQSYGPAYVQGDVIGVGFRPRSGTVFFTRNGKRLEDAFVGLHRYNLFPTIAADGAAEVHVNLGQAGFVFIEANVKKWGLAPMVGTLAPPPPYGQERGSILIETGQGGSSDANQNGNDLLHPPRNITPPPPLTPPNERSEEDLHPSSSSSSLSRRARARRNRQMLPPLNHTSSSESYHRGNSGETTRRDSMSSSDDEPHNPPTPHHLDISLHSLDALGTANNEEEEGVDSSRSGSSSQTQTVRGRRQQSNNAGYFPYMFSSNNGENASASHTRSPSPPPYSDLRSGWPSDSGALGGTSAAHNQARRGSGRTHSLANALLGALADRGLLTPLSAQDGTTHSSSGSGSSPTGSYERLASHGQLNQDTSSNNQNGQSWLSSWFR